MGKFSKNLFLVALICSAGAALAQAPPAPTPYTLPPGWIEPGEPRPPYVLPETPQGSGPHPAIMVAETIAPGADFVSYYPASLSQLGGKKLPILVWGNGSCAYVGNRFRHFLQDIASHDYFVLAGGEMVMDKGEAETIDMSVNPVLTNPDEPAPAAAPARAAPVTAQQNFDQSNDPNRKRVTYELLSKGVDWAIAENKRPGSKFFGKLDTSHIATMGNSCGGGLASKFAGDRRIKTIGILSSASAALASPANADVRRKLTQPLLLLSGDPRYDPAFWGAIKDYEVLDKAKVFYAWRMNMVHMGTYRQTNGGELAPLAEAWLDWQLKGDLTAAKWFTGPKCGLCTNTHYHVRRRNLS